MLHRIITFLLQLLTRLFGEKPIAKGVRIVTADGYTVTDKNGHYITLTEV